MAVHNTMEIDTTQEKWPTVAKPAQPGEEDSLSNSSASSPIRIRAVTYGNRNSRSRRKERVSQACTACRQKKTKCNGDKPTCNKCEERDTKCVYATAVQKKSNDVQMLDLYHPLEAVKDRLVDLQMVTRTSASSLDMLISTKGDAHPTAEIFENLGALDPKSHEILSSFEMPSKHSATVASLAIHFPDIREAAEVPPLSKAEHLSSLTDHCPSDCSSCVRPASMSEAKSLFDSFLQNIFVFYPFLNTTAAWEAFDQVVHQECTAQFVPNLDGSETNQQQEVEYIWGKPLDQPIGLLIFALGALCKRGTNKYPLCCTPGKKYFARATRILEYHIGSTKLEFVNAWLLAAMYMSLLNDMQRSFWCLRKASGSLSVMLQDHPEVFGYRTIDEHTNMINLTYWTWFQLESDLLSDVCYRPSETFAYADEMPLPQNSVNTQRGNDRQSGGSELDDLKPNIHTLDLDFAIRRFQEHVKLRKILNQIYGTLYRFPCLDQSSATTIANPNPELREQLTKASYRLWIELQEWRKNLHPELQWSYRNYIPSSVIDTCLREKYYRACTLATRPCLQQLRQSENGETDQILAEFDQSELESEAIAQTQGLTNSTDVARRLEHHLNIDYKVVLNAARCIVAAKQGVMVFSNIPSDTENLIAQNIFGIMQAIYTNIRLLYSLRQHIGYLSGLILVEELRFLLPKIVEFFERCSGESAEIRKNIKMIKDILHNLSQ